MIMLTDEEKVFNKNPWQLGVEGNVFVLTQVIHKKPTASIVTNGEKFKALLLSWVH